MTFWDWLYRLGPGWPKGPTERQYVTVGVFALLTGLLVMAYDNPALWDIEVYKVIIQAVALTGLLNMILAFHFAANKSDETKTENTAKAFDAITATAQANVSPAAQVEDKIDEVVEATVEAGEEAKRT